MSKGKKDCLFGIVCDGIGGLEEGENASGYVVRQVMSWFRTNGYKRKSRKKLESEVSQLLFQIHEELKAYGEGKGIKLGTTMTFFLIHKNLIFWGHAGDSRLYLIKKGRVKQLTVDHKEADGALNQAIGAGDWKLISTGWKHFWSGESVLLCTDGFYRSFSNEEIRGCLDREFMSERQIQRMLVQMGQRASAMGEKDNISALFCRKSQKRRMKEEGNEADMET